VCLSFEESERTAAFGLLTVETVRQPQTHHPVSVDVPNNATPGPAIQWSTVQPYTTPGSDMFYRRQRRQKEPTVATDQSLAFAAIGKRDGTRQISDRWRHRKLTSDESPSYNNRCLHESGCSSLSKRRSRKEGCGSQLMLMPKPPLLLLLLHEALAAAAAAAAKTGEE
jgi:hypothetical protein